MVTHITYLKNTFEDGTVERWIFELSDVITVLFVCVYHAGTTAKLIMKKTPTEEKIFDLPITIKDNAGMGITHLFEGEFIL